MGSHKLISSDDHVIEPPDLWSNRVEPKFRERAPKLVRLEKGTDWWFTDGVKGQSPAFGSQTGDRFEGNEGLAWGDKQEHVRPGAYDPHERIKDMGIDGIDVSFIFPTQGLSAFTIKDTELCNAVMEAYNDWIAEYCSAHPDRLKGIAMINLDDIEWAVNELERSSNLGLVGAMIPSYPKIGKNYDLPEYDPFWAAAQESGTPLSFHLGTNRPNPDEETIDLETITSDWLCNVDFFVRMSLAQMILGGVFEKYPKLQVGSIEHEIAWVVHFVERLDYTYTQRPLLPHWHRYKENMLPSDYFHRNVFLSFQEDIPGIKIRELIGVDSLQWGSDYPHVESTFPRSKEILEEILADCTEEEKAKITGKNVARVYNLN